MSFGLACCKHHLRERGRVWEMLNRTQKERERERDPQTLQSTQSRISVMSIAMGTAILALDHASLALFCPASGEGSWFCNAKGESVRRITGGRRVRIKARGIT